MPNKDFMNVSDDEGQYESVISWWIRDISTTVDGEMTVKFTLDNEKTRGFGYYPLIGYRLEVNGPTNATDERNFEKSLSPYSDHTVTFKNLDSGDYQVCLDVFVQ